MTQRIAAMPRLVALALSTALMASCAAGQAGSESGEVDARPGASTLGNYLAGRHAHSQRRTDLAGDFYKAVLDEAQDVPRLRQRTFRLLAAEGRFDAAVPLAKELAADKRDPMADLTLVVDAVKSNDLAAALALSDAASTAGPNRFLLPLARAWAHAGLGEGESAYRELESLASSNGLKTLVGMHRALIGESVGQSEVAAAAYRETWEAGKGGNTRLVQMFGNFLERVDRAQEAFEIYRGYLADHPGNRTIRAELERAEQGLPPPRPVPGPEEGLVEALFDVANFMRQRNDRDSAMIFSRLALHLRPDNALLRVLLAEMLEADDRLAAANELYRTIDRTSNLAWTARLAMAANLDEMGRTDEAVAALEKMARDFPAEPDPLIDLGDVLRGRDRFEEAARAYSGALARIGEPRDEHWSLYYTRGISYERSKRWDDAEADFLKALELQPDQPYVLNYLGYSWVERRKNMERARAMIETAVKAQPTDGYIVDSLGWVLYQLEDFAGAVKHLERAVELRPHDPVINDHLGDAYWRVGRKKEARFQWRRALGLEPEEDVVERIEQKLKSGLPAPEEAASDPGET